MKDWREYDITDYRRLEYWGRDSQQMLVMLLEHIQVGVGLFEVGERIRALYLNDAYFDCIGCSKEAYGTICDDVFSTLILEDAELFYNYIIENHQKEMKIDYEVRGTRQDGSIGWFQIQAMPIENQITDKPIYLAMVTDVSIAKERDEQQRRLQRVNSELAIQKERYRMLEATTQGILFEYFPAKDKMVFSYNLPNNRKRKEIEHYQQYLKQFPMVHSDHIAAFTETLENACKQQTEGSLEYLSTVSGGGYRWHITYYKSVKDNSGKIASVLGRICDIHDAKIEKQRMNYRTERDGMTNVYYKDAAFEKMSEYVAEAPFSKFYFAILDLDNFKNINDQFGKQYGDIVMKDFSAMLQKLFAEESIVGRLGGDEFILLTKNIALAEVRRRLTQIQDKISFSAGIIEWKYGERMERIFDKADKAVIQAKSNGKNGIVIN